MKRVKFFVLFACVVALGFSHVLIRQDSGVLTTIALLLALIVVLINGLVLFRPPWLLRFIKNQLGKTRNRDVSRNADKILFVSSNGAGLGHLTRLVAVADQFDYEQFHIYTLSAGFDKLTLPRKQVTYFPSYGTLDMEPSQWEILFSHSLESVLGSFRPKVVVFDGTSVYRPLTAACRKRGIELIWLQRGCWKRSVDKASVQRHNADIFADHVIIPGDYGCDELVDAGPRLNPQYVAPIVSVRDGQMKNREEACADLGLDPSGKYVLIQLGAGVINDIKELRGIAADFLSDDFTPVVTRNPLKSLPPDTLLTEVEAYPIAQYFEAFEFGIFAAGYNSVQEAVSLRLPSIFIPNLNTGTDDQERRAIEIEAKGLGLAATTIDELRNAVERMSADEFRETVRGNLSDASKPTGAQEVAEIIKKLSASVH